VLLRTPIQFCKSCGQSAQYRLPDDGDTKPRAVCTVCHTVHYENPLLIVGTIPYLESQGLLQVLLCLRNIEPRKGKWTLPAGFMELGETTAQGAARETQEEAGADIEMQAVFTMLSVPIAGQVHVFYRAKLLSETYHPGYETVKVQLFSEDQLPWDELAFTTVKTTLRHFFDDAKTGVFRFHEHDLTAPRP